MIRGTRSSGNGRSFGPSSPVSSKVIPCCRKNRVAAPARSGQAVGAHQLDGGDDVGRVVLRLAVAREHLVEETLGDAVLQRSGRGL
jgi:hypothetical protein